MKNAVIATLVVALAVSIAAGVIARATRTVNVEVRVWQDVGQPDALWLSARPDGGSWADLGTIPVLLDDGISGTGRYRYGDVVLALSVSPPPSCADAALAADCAVLLAARDALAGDGALNWSADLPLTQWDGVTVSGTPRRVTGLDLRNRGLTGTIPPELGSLPPTLSTVHLAGNAFTGCVPERLRLAANDLEALTMERRIWYCSVPEMPYSDDALAPGTYHIDGNLIVDIPEDGPQVKWNGREVMDSDEQPGISGYAYCFSDIEDRWGMCLDAFTGKEWGRLPYYQAPPLPTEMDAVFDQIAATARPAPPPPLSCAEPSLAADCAVLLAARDALAGDGALNWSADLPLTQWDGVTVSGTPRRVTGLDLRNRGLTGTIPPELGSLPPTLSTVYLAGNAFTGCVPERLRLAETNDLEALTKERRIWYCPVPPIPHGVALAAGTYEMEGIIVDIPTDGPRVQRTWTVDGNSEYGGGGGECLSDLADIEWICFGSDGKEISRGPSAGGAAIVESVTGRAPAGLDDVFDQIAATARLVPPLSCWEESLAPDCAILLAARDALMGDGALNWSPDVPVEEWDGVNVPWSSRRVEGLYLRRYGLTGTIPPELGSLPPTLSTVYLAGNAFTGCIPERLRLAMSNDLETLRKERGLPWCPVAAMPSGGVPLAPGTYQVRGTLIVDIPATGPRLIFSSTIYGDSDSDMESGIAHCFTDLAKQGGLCLDAYLLTPSRFRPDGAVPGTDDASVLDAVFDQITATARPMPPPLCGKESLVADCAILLAARDTLAGDGVLNWSADVPVTEWDGVSVSGTPRRVTGLDLRNRGLTGTIPPELGSLPPTLVRLHLAGNAFTGCVPERLRLAVANDLEQLMAERGLPWCPVAALPSGGAELPTGTWQIDGSVIVDIPAGSPRVKMHSAMISVRGLSFCLSDLDEQYELCLDPNGGERQRGLAPRSRSSGATEATDNAIPAALDALFDAIVARARPVP